jgi:hypothetical protein
VVVTGLECAGSDAVLTDSSTPEMGNAAAVTLAAAAANVDSADEAPSLAVARPAAVVAAAAAVNDDDL